ncbi:MAG: hypothetical protein JWO31_600 [Phycisphaerales bacterium]|nr:hypothetical protein [Phycisphaerales bacterium]
MRRAREGVVSRGRIGFRLKAAAMTDDRINFAAVLAAVRDPRNRNRVIWSPGTTLAVMGIERFPYDPPANYRAMKRVLADLRAAGFLVQRPRTHRHFTLREVAYERPAAGGPAGTVTEAYDGAGTSGVAP